MDEENLDNEPVAAPEPEFYERPVNFARPQNRWREPQPPRRKRWWLYFILIVLIAGGVNCGIRHYSLSELPADPGAYDSVTLKPRQTGFLQTVKNYFFKSSKVLAGEIDDRVNILLLGMGGAGHDGPYLTDTNIILSIKPSTRQVAMISIPRDLGADIPGYGVYKINFANALGEAKNAGNGGEFARAIFAKSFDLDIPYYIRVDFKAFEDLINAVGGVTIDVPRAFTDTEFPGPNESFDPISFTASMQTMNGKRALQYARSRHGNNGEGSDFARSRRQQQVLSALKGRLLSFGTYTNPIKIQQMLSTLASHVTTNLNFGQIMYLAGMAREADDSVTNLVLDDSPQGFLISYFSKEGAFLLGPKDGNFDAINTAIKNVFEKNSTSDSAATGTAITAKNTTASNPAIFPSANIEIQNGTWRAGLAAKYEAVLATKGFSVTTIGNSSRRPLDKTAMYLVRPGVSAEITADLEKELKLKSTTALPEWLLENYDDPTTSSTEVGPKYKPETNILIVLGDDANE
ncbi:MAG: LCP family protein [Candidatus Magasanikbacteria bacterium]|jgi:LCP family protein required for cell wall assembly